MLASFPFTRLTNSEVASLFEVYRISLGHSETQRDFVISHMCACPRPSFEDILHQALAMTKETEHYVMIDYALGVSCCVK